MNEKYLCPTALAESLDIGITPEYIRECCYRKENAIPHLELGKRALRIRPSVFMAWLMDEEQRNTTGV